MDNPYLFDLTKSAPTVKKPFGTVQGAYETVFPIVAGQKAAMFLVVLEKGGIREPHWHPTAWEFDYCISGRARMAIVGPKGERKTFEVEAGHFIISRTSATRSCASSSSSTTALPKLTTISASRCRSAASPTACWRQPSACPKAYSIRSPSGTRR